MTLHGDEDPIDLMERIRQLTVKVYSTISVMDRKIIAASRFLSGISDRVFAQQLLAA